MGMVYDDTLTWEQNMQLLEDERRPGQLAEADFPNHVKKLRNQAFEAMDLSQEAGRLTDEAERSGNRGDHLLAKDAHERAVNAHEGLFTAYKAAGDEERERRHAAYVDHHEMAWAYHKHRANGGTKGPFNGIFDPEDDDTEDGGGWDNNDDPDTDPPMITPRAPGGRSLAHEPEYRMAESTLYDSDDCTLGEVRALREAKLDEDLDCPRLLEAAPKPLPGGPGYHSTADEPPDDYWGAGPDEEDVDGERPRPEFRDPHEHVEEAGGEHMRSQYPESYRRGYDDGHAGRVRHPGIMNRWDGYAREYSEGHDVGREHRQQAVPHFFGGDHTTVEQVPFPADETVEEAAGEGNYDDLSATRVEPAAPKLSNSGAGWVAPNYASRAGRGRDAFDDIEDDDDKASADWSRANGVKPPAIYR